VNLVLGIMSGTSLDGVDMALCRVGQEDIALETQGRAKFPPWLHGQLDRAAAGLGSIHQLGQLHHDLGRFYAQAARRFSGQARLVGLHGQTIYHQPNQPAPATFQLGEPAYLAEALQVPVVSNFRASDLAAGGQGAPLVTLFHRLVFAEAGQHVCVNNLGGISNVTSLDWTSGKEPKLLAFDTGPANLLTNLAVSSFTDGRKLYDLNGSWARRGTARLELVKRWLRHPFIGTRPPKSTGREEFGERFLVGALGSMKRLNLKKADMLATLIQFVGESIAKNYALHLPSPPTRVVLAGGGVKNRALVGTLSTLLSSSFPGVRLMTSRDFGWPLETVEAGAFALLAYRRIQGKPGNIPKTTGARHPALLGQITEPFTRRKIKG